MSSNLTVRAEHNAPFMAHHATLFAYPAMKKFSRRHSMLFNKYAVSVKRHIREGICIPLDVKPDLVRNITTRNGGCGQCA